MTICGISISLALSGILSYLLAFLQGLQLVFHLPMLWVIVPGNVSNFLAIVLPVMQFDLLDSSWTTEKIYTFDTEAQEELNELILDQMEDLGYDSHNSILLLGSIFIYIVAYFALLMLLPAIKKLLGPKSKYWVKLYKIMVFNFIIAIFYECHLEMLISGILNFKHPLYSTNGETSGFVFSLFLVIVTMIFMPLFFIWMLFQDKK